MTEQLTLSLFPERISGSLYLSYLYNNVVVVQPLSCVLLFVIPWTAAPVFLVLH